MRRSLILLALVSLAACSGGEDAVDTTATAPTTSAADMAPTAATTVPEAPTTTSEPTTAAESTTTTPPPEPADVAARPSPGCDDPTGAAAGETILSHTIGDTPGRFLLELPASDDGAAPVPLVIDLHGYSETLEIHRSFSDLVTTGAEQGFAVAVPQVDREIPRWDTALDSADVAFVVSVLDRIVAENCIDEARVFMTGMSNGAFMTSTMACVLSHRIAAAAPVAGLRNPEGCAPTRPVPVISFHGTADEFVAYDGGLGAAAANLPTPGGGTLGTGVLPDDGPTLEEMTAAWATRNGCADTSPDSTPVADDVDLLTWTCPPEGEALLYRVNGGGHSWPGSAFSAAAESIVGFTTMSIDANELMWEFFSAHPLPVG